MLKTLLGRPIFVSLSLLLLCASAEAEQNPVGVPNKSRSEIVATDKNVGKESASAEALQKATQNPVANLISVPIQNNDNFGIGPYDRTQNVLNIQPVISAHISKDWMLISRIIQPIVWQPYPEATTGGKFGLGDMNPTFFLSPAKPGKVIWGAGPAFVIPTATNNVLGQGKLSIGPSFVALAQPGHWTIGGLVNNVWSVAGSGSRPAVNQMLFQYFINYNLNKGYYVTVSPIITADWKASNGNTWTTPVGGGLGGS
jgi:hypothetical protein